MLKVIIYLFVFIFGACWGSFLNCLVYRLEQNKGKTILKEKSFCPKCKHKLGFWDLIPVVSFICLKRKCRYCKEKIAWQYLAVEVATGLVFLLISNFQFPISNEFTISNYQTLISLFYYWFVASCLIVIFVYDLKHYIIPDWAIYPALAVILFFIILNLFGNWKLVIGNLLAGIGLAGFFFLLWALSRGKWIGFGDVKLGFLMGFLLGFPNVLLAVFIACFMGSLLGICLIVAGRKKLKSQLPFAPFLITGTFTALFWGDKIISWYLNFLV